MDCNKGFMLLANPYTDAYLKQALIEKMRNQGCLQ
jgi:hypothetical protein